MQRTKDGKIDKRAVGWLAGVGVCAAVLVGAVQLGEAAAAHTPAKTAAADVPAENATANVELREWQVPWPESRPRDPYVDNQDRVWFVGQRTHYVAYLDPETGEFERYDLDDGVGPHNLIVDEEGIVWYAGNRAAHIGKLDPETGEITKYPTPEPHARDPHTLDFGAGDLIWFSSQGGNGVGRFDSSSGEVDVVPLPTERARPYGLVVAPDGRPWFTEFGTNKLGTIDPESMELTEHDLPREETRPRRLQLTSDGAVWYVDYAEGYLGRLDPASGEVREWRAPAAGESRPYAMAVDDQDRLWFVETGPSPNRLVGFDPSTEEFFSVTEIESGGGAVRHMVYHAPHGAIWFGTDTNTIGRAVLP